jgi:putative ABC transport system permease protein
VGAVVTIMTLGKSAYATVEKTIYGSGAGSIDITHNYGGVGGRTVLPFNESFAAMLEAAEIAGVDKYSFEMDEMGVMVLNSQEDSMNARLVPTTVEVVKELEFLAGEPFTSDDEEWKSQVAVVDNYLAKKLFGSPMEAVGETFNTDQGLFFQVVGVSKATHSESDYGTMYAPLSLQELKPSFQVDGYDRIIAHVKVGANYKNVTQALNNYLVDLLGYEDEEEMTVIVGSVNAMMEQVSAFMNTFAIGLSLIAAISLVVGGVGIMNIMLVSVTERTKEIGLMKALGAQDGDIVFQFLVESVVMTIFGGLLGVSLGLGMSLGVIKLVNVFGGENLPRFIFVMDYSSIMVSLGVSVVIGLLFGAYPARRAAKLLPVEALRRD